MATNILERNPTIPNPRVRSSGFGRERSQNIEVEKNKNITAPVI